MDNDIMISQQGLTSKQVEERMQNGQYNKDAMVHTKSVRQIVTENTMTLFNLVNLLLALCLLFVGSFRNMLFLGVAIGNLAIGIVQELRAKRVIDKLSIVSASKALVIRDGQEVSIPKEQAVIDDLMIFKLGMQVCADAVVVSGECEVNESLLTGESDSVTKKQGDKIMSGSYIISGEVYAQAEGIGEDSYSNQIIAGAKYMKKVKSEIKDSVMIIIRIISAAIFPIAILLFLNQRSIEGASFVQAVEKTVAGLILMIPEGFVLLTSVVMAVSVIRLSRKKTLVQEPYCVETLARVDVFCMDKTGTVTEGNMRVIGCEELSDDCRRIVSNMVGALREDNPTFLAVKEYYGEDRSLSHKEMIPFSSERKWSLVEFEQEGIYALGAPEFLCRKPSPELAEILSEHIQAGDRVLMLAKLLKLPDGNVIEEQAEPKGLIFIEDILRKNAGETIGFLEEQGVELKLISGDNPISASKIAQKAGIRHAENYIDCSTIEDEEGMRKAASYFTVFGRVSPLQKKIIINELHRQKHTVAMTGDGVNDVLSLKEADCGIAMQEGSEAARNVSEIILMNSDFSAIPSIIAEGRRSINNLTRSAVLFLTKTIFACIMAVLFCFIKSQYPFQAIQMSLISATCIGIPSFFLALERNHSIVKKGFLKRVFGKAVPSGLLIVINVLFCLAVNSWLKLSAAESQTFSMFLCTVVFGSLLFKICMPFNWYRGILFGGLIFIYLFAVLYFGPLFYVTKLPVAAYFLFAPASLLNILIIQGFSILTAKLKEAGANVTKRA